MSRAGVATPASRWQIFRLRYYRDLAYHRQLSNQLARLTRSTTKLRDRFAGTLRPFSRHAITLSPYCQRRCAVARAMPNRQQIAFHGARSARAQTSLASSASSQRSQPQRLLHPADRGGRRRWQPHRLRLLANAIGKLHDHLRPGVEVARHAHRRQPTNQRTRLRPDAPRPFRRSSYPRSASRCSCCRRASRRSGE